MEKVSRSALPNWFWMRSRRSRAWTSWGSLSGVPSDFSSSMMWRMAFSSLAALSRLSALRWPVRKQMRFLKSMLS